MLGFNIAVTWTLMHWRKFQCSTDPLHKLLLTLLVVTASKLCCSVMPCMYSEHTINIHNQWGKKQLKSSLIQCYWCQLSASFLCHCCLTGWPWDCLLEALARFLLRFPEFLGLLLVVLFAWLHCSVSEMEVVVPSLGSVFSPAVSDVLGGRVTYIPGCMARSFFGSIRPFLSCWRLTSDSILFLLICSASEWSNSFSSSPRSRVHDA